MPACFPFFVDISHKKILVFGAGKIAARRVAGLLCYGAAVTVAAPQIGEDIRNLCKKNPERLLIRECAYRPGEIREEEADYVLAATDDKEVNAKICRECRHKEIPVNNASDRTQCDFYFPALVARDGLVIGVTSTDGNHKKVVQYCENLRGQDLRSWMTEQAEAGGQNPAKTESNDRKI